MNDIHFRVYLVTYHPSPCVSFQLDLPAYFNNLIEMKLKVTGAIPLVAVLLLSQILAAQPGDVPFCDSSKCFTFKLVICRSLRILHSRITVGPSLVAMGL